MVRVYLIKNWLRCNLPLALGLNTISFQAVGVGDQLVVTNSILPTNQFFRLRRR